MHRQAARLRQLRVVQRPVLQVFDPRARIGTNHPVGRIQHPDLVHARHRNEQPPVMPGQVPRRGQFGLQRRVRAGCRVTARPCARHRGHLARAEIDPPDPIVLRIRHVQVIAGTKRQPLRIRELRLRRRTVPVSVFRRPEHPPHHARVIRLHDPVVTRVRDIERFVAGQHLPRKRQAACPSPALAPARAAARPSRCTGRPVLAQDAGHCAVQALKRRLARVETDHVTQRVHKHHRRPGAHAVGLPDLEVRVVDHRMLQPVPPRRVAHVERLALRRELGRVHAHHRQRRTVLLFEFPQLRK